MAEGPPAGNVDVGKIIEAAELCANAAVAGDDLLAWRYAHAIIRLARTEIPVARSAGIEVIEVGDD